MKNHFWRIGCLVCLFSFHLSAQSYDTIPLPEKIRDLPDGIKVTHHPNPVYASLDENEPDIYFWKHDTQVSTLVGELQVVEFGAYLLGKEGWFLRASMTPRQFKNWFEAKKARLQPEQIYVFEKNWRRDTRLYGGTALWYVIAEDRQGKKFRGYSIIETVGELK